MIFNFSPSMPMGSYIRLPFTHYTRGGIVRFCLRADLMKPIRTLNPGLGHGPCPGQNPYLIKRVIAIPGDTVSVKTYGISVDGHDVQGSTIPPNNRAGQYAIVKPGDYTVPGGYVWVMSDDYYGYDSRYYGAVLPLDSALPFWTWH
jgi:conjugative transfer signal peptidase TraF